MMRLSEVSGYGYHLTVALAALVGGSLLTAGAVQAQKKKAAAGQQSAWVKLCEAPTLTKAKKGGGQVKEKKNICLTHHERLDGNTGMVIVSAAIRRVEGQKEPSLMVMVPLGMAIPPGMKAAVYNKDQWARAQKKEKVADKELKPISLKYSLCHPAGCTAEIKINENVVKSMKTGGGLMVLALNATGKPVAFPIPLTGFTKAHDGKPVDNKVYSSARANLMSQIRERMRARLAQRATGGKLPQPKKN
ncbi:MAG: invasion associated locus B family protein [Pseudomonadota bacterium]